jgi:hypothetical protein
MQNRMLRSVLPGIAGWTLRWATWAWRSGPEAAASISLADVWGSGRAVPLGWMSNDSARDMNHVPVSPLQRAGTGGLVPVDAGAVLSWSL